jgi:hypothetical protein
MSLPPLLHSPDFWIGFASCFSLLALIALALLACASPDLRAVRWPALPPVLPPVRASRARLARLDRAEARRWPHDDYAANEEGELNPDRNPLTWASTNRAGGDL